MARLPRTVLLLAWVSFFNDVASDMVIPLLPLLLSGPVGGGAIALGAIEGTAEAVASLMRLWAGRRSDRTGGRRKPLALAGYMVSNAVRPLLGLAPMWWGLLGLRALDRVGKGLRSAPRDALMVDVTPPEQRGQAFGLHRAFDNAGAVLGALLAALILQRTGADVRTVVVWSALPGATAVLLLAFGVRESPLLRPVAGAQSPASSPRPLRSPALVAYLRALLVFTLSRSSETFIILRGSELGLRPGTLLLLWAGLNAAKAVTAQLGGGWADRHGRLFILRFSWFGNVLSSLGLALAPSAPWLAVVALLGSLPVGLGEGAERAHIADLAPAEQRGTAYGWYNLTTGLAAIPAGLLFGGLWQWAGAPLAFAAAAVLALGALLLLPAQDAQAD
jgi:MFS family permease